MISVARLTCLSTMAAFLLGACSPKSSGNAGPSFVDSGARDLQTDPASDAGGDDGAPADGRTTTDGAPPDAPADAPGDAPAGDTPTADTASPDTAPDAPATDTPAADTAGDAAPDTRDAAGDPTLTPDLPGLDLRDALPDLGSDARDGAPG
jgi:hypothetical protein